MDSSDQIIEDFLKLGFNVLEEGLPKLKELRRSYHKLSKEKHPDKHSGADETTRRAYEEEFQELLNSYNNAANYIIENDKEEKDDEENLVREEFIKVNMVKINATSVVFYVPTMHVHCTRMGEYF